MTPTPNAAGRPSEGDRFTSYDVRIWKTEVYKGVKHTTYTVRWSVGGKRHRQPHRTRALADAFRSKLKSYQNDGVAFDVDTGLPLPMWRQAHQSQQKATPTWYEHAIAYVDRQWPDASYKQRASIADALATVTPALVRTELAMPDARLLRRALSTWAFNANARAAGAPSAREAAALKWLEENSLNVTELADADLMERALAVLATKLDGTRAAANTYRRKRPIFYAALRYAVKRKFLTAHPLGDPDIEFVAPKAVEAIDPRTVPNPKQARALLDAVGEVQPSGPALKAFFGCIYYAGMRPGEVARVREDDFEMPTEGTSAWGTVYVHASAPRAGKTWTDNGKTRQEGPLKHRPAGTVRPAPVPPPLALLIREHITTHGTTVDGRLFRGHYGGEVAESTYGRVWQVARAAVLTPPQAASELARRPYDLRHACVSTWLNAGVDRAQVAEWAGHSVEVLMRIYYHCMEGGKEEARKRIERALGEDD